MKIWFRLCALIRFFYLLVLFLFTAAISIVSYVLHQVVEWLATPFATRLPRRGDVILITGASTGIGLSAAMRLQEYGFKVFAGVRNDDDFRRLKNLGLNPIMCDVTKKNDIQNAIRTIEDEVAKSGGDTQLAALINNAGVCIPGPFEEQNDDLDIEMFAANVLGAMSMTRAFIPLMRRYRSRLIFTGSVSGYLPQPAVATYTATKFAIRGLALCLAEELQPMGVSVSVIEPAQTSTPIFDKAQQALGGSKQYSGLVKLVDFYNHVLVRMMAASPENSTDRAIVNAVTSRRPMLQYRSNWTATLHHFLSTMPPSISIGTIVTTMYRGLFGMNQGWTLS